MTKFSIMRLAENQFATRGNLKKSIEDLGMRAKISVFEESGLILIRVSRDVEILFRDWVESRRMIGIQVLVVGDLRWWECLWARVKI